MTEVDQAEELNMHFVQWRQANPAASMREAYFAGCAVPEGWQLVPSVPTDEMQGAAQDNWVPGLPSYEAGAVWSAMLAAAPTPPIASQAVEVQATTGSLQQLIARTKLNADLPNNGFSEFRVADIKALLDIVSQEPVAYMVPGRFKELFFDLEEACKIGMITCEDVTPLIPWPTVAKGA